MALTDVKIRALKPKDKIYLIADGEGLNIEVAKSGSKLWRFRYRFNGKPRILALGKYPEVSLKEARLKLAEARKPSAMALIPESSASVISRRPGWVLQIPSERLQKSILKTK